MSDLEKQAVITDASISREFVGSTDSCMSLEKCKKTNIEYDDLSPLNSHTSQKSLYDTLISFDGDLGMQWKGSWI